METPFGRGQQRSPCWLTTYPSPGMILHSLNGYYPLKICRDPNGKDRLPTNHLQGADPTTWDDPTKYLVMGWSIHPNRWILNLVKPTQPTLNQLGTYESWDDPSKSLTFLFLFWARGLDSTTGRFGGRCAEMAAHARLGAGNWGFFWNAKVWTGNYTPGSTKIAG